jgi:MFS family permease
LRAALTDVVGFTWGSSFFAPQTVLQEFVTHLTSSNVLIGLTSSVVSSGASLPQVLVASTVERLPVKKWYVLVMASVERLLFLVLALLTPVLAATRPGAMFAVLLLLVGAHYGVMGCSIPAYSGMISKVIPARQRGRLFGWGSTLGNLLVAASGLAIPGILAADDWWGGFPNGFAVCFFAGFAVLTATYIPLAFLDEPKEPASGPRARGVKFAGLLWDIVRRDRDYRWFLVYGWCSAFGLAGSALYVAYSLRALGAPAGQSGWFAALVGAGAMTSGLWGLLADRKDNRVVLFSAGLLLTVAPVWAVCAPSLGWFYPVVFLTAVGGWGSGIASYNVQMEFSPSAQVPRYVALTSLGLFVPRLAAPLVGGALADAWGYRAVFLFAAACSAAGLFAAWRMADPRQSGREAAAPVR